MFKAVEGLEQASLVVEEKSLTHKQMRIKRLTPLGQEITKFREDVSRFDESYFQLLDLVMESFILSEDTPKDVLNRKLRVGGWTIEKIKSYPELSERARSFGVPFFMFSLNAVIVRYSVILASYKVNKTATNILTRMLLEEVTLGTTSIPRIIQGIGYSGSDPTEFTQRIFDSLFKTAAIIFLELVRQTIPNGKLSGLTDMFEIKAIEDYFQSLNMLYRPSKDSVVDLVNQIKNMTEKDEKLRNCIPFLEKLLQST